MGITTVSILPHAERGQSATGWPSAFLAIGHCQNGAVVQQVGKCVCRDGPTEVVALYFVTTVSAQKGQLRGLAKVRSVVGLFVLAHNLMRMAVLAP